MPKIVTVVGNRPQFVKLGVTARRLREMGEAAPFSSVVVNTGQHYDAMLSDVFFSELQIEPPNYQLGIGSGNIVDQIGKMLSPLREIFDSEAPDAVLVYGDTNSTAAAAIAAAHANIPLIHVEGGERLYRRADMPEEVNRVLTDHLADLCLASSRKAVRFLDREGFAPERAVFVGDPMLDIFLFTGELLRERGGVDPSRLGLRPGEYILSTMHRAENTDSREVGLSIMQTLDDAPMPVLLPAHPRLRNRLEAWGWSPRNALRLIEPVGYFDFQSLLRQSALVVSDSGGVNREAFFAGKGCIVPLETNAWTEAVEAGFAVTVGHEPGRLRDALHRFRPVGEVDAVVRHHFGNGDAGVRIVDEIAGRFCGGARRSEGPWHAVRPFADLPRATDSTSLGYSNLVAIAALLQDTPETVTGRLYVDLSDGLDGAEQLGRLLSHLGLPATFLLSPEVPSTNLLSGAAKRIIRALAEAGHLFALHPESRAEDAQLHLLGHWLEIEIARAGRPAKVWRDVEPDGTINEVALEAAVKQGAALYLAPRYWSDIPASPFEAMLRVADNRREEALERLRRP